MRIAYLGIIFFAIISMASSCEFENDYNSVSGLWHCEEDNQILVTFRNYETTITRTATNLDNEITIYNFFDLGGETETIGILINDSTIELKNGPISFSTGYIISGTGKANSSFDRIEWIYHVSINGVDYQDISALYYR